MKAMILTIASVLVGPAALIAQDKPLTSYEVKFVEEVNKVRTNPKAYISMIREYLKIGLPSEKEIAENELIPLLDTLSPRKALVISEKIRYQMEYYKGVDSTKKWCDHDLDYMKNIQNFQSGAQNIVMGCKLDQQTVMVVRQLIDLAAPTRGHRHAILNPEFTHTAVRTIIFGDIRKPLSCRIWWIQDFISFKDKK